jgi:GNAT superfamily N-acetyltransferase
LSHRTSLSGVSSSFPFDPGDDRVAELREARFPEDADLVRAIFREYADSLGFDLGFQDFETELAQLPGKYAAPGGCVLLAGHGGAVVGCVALRPSGPGVAEMKRLYVRPGVRGLRLGRRLAEAVCEAARRAGYDRIRLDTLPSMQAARAIYAELGFVPTEPYAFNPMPGATFLERVLGD